MARLCAKDDLRHQPSLSLHVVRGYLEAEGKGTFLVKLQRTLGRDLYEGESLKNMARSSSVAADRMAWK